MKNVLTCTLLFLLCNTSFLFAQSEKEKLQQALLEAKPDTSKVWLLHKIAGQYRSASLDSMIHYYNEALEVSRQLDFTEGMLSSMYRLSTRYQFKGEREKEKEIVLEALEMAQNQKSAKWQADFMKQLGTIHFRDLKYDSAYYAYIETDRILVSLGMEYTTWHNNYLLCKLFDAQGDHEKAEQYLEKAYQQTKAKAIRKHYGWILVMQLEYYLRRKNHERYAMVSEEYLQFKRARKTPLKSSSPHNFLFQFDKEHPEEIIKELETLIAHHRERNNELSLLESYTYLGNVKKQAGDYDGAIAAYLTSVEFAEKLSYKTSVADNYKYIYETFELDNNYAAAFPYIKKHHHIIDSLNSVEIQKNLSELEVKYETVKKDEALVKQQLALEKAAQSKRIFSILAIAGALLATVALWFLYFKTKTNRLLQSQKTVIQKALGEKEILLKEIHHRVKNNLQVISSLLNWQSKYIDDHKALQSMQEGRNRVQSMALIHQNLYQTDNLTGIEVADYIDKLGNSLFNSYKVNHDQVKFESNVEALNLDVDTLIPLGLILNELLSNALKYAFPEGREGEIQVTLQKQEESLLLEVKDNGVGIQEEETKKGKDSFGYKLIEAFAEKLKAQLQIDHSYGTTVRLLIQNFKVV